MKPIIAEQKVHRIENRANIGSSTKLIFVTSHYPKHMNLITFKICIYVSRNPLTGQFRQIVAADVTVDLDRHRTTINAPDYQSCICFKLPNCKASRRPHLRLTGRLLDSHWTSIGDAMMHPQLAGPTLQSALLFKRL